LNTQQRAAIGAAIETAETKTSGEIFCVVARKSGDYSWTTLVYGMVLALVAPLIMLLFGVTPLDLADSLARVMGGGWSAGVGASSSDEAATGLTMIVAIQVLIVILVSCIGLNSDMREALTPAFIKRQAVHRCALEQFLAHGIHLTEGRTGVLIYTSLSEHQAEIVADTAIFNKVDRNVWSGAIQVLLKNAREGDLSAGIIGAIEKSGDVLSAHFPRAAGDTDELPNKVVII
jgi:putative membrane protein